ncbi:hypothetical protein DFH27DRAFT_616861 [Peziza echinospora]|nr:hypothetical protein DFH27DRAFT_616861 [Peziza echinospora]
MPKTGDLILNFFFLTSLLLPPLPPTASIKNNLHGKNRPLKSDQYLDNDNRPTSLPLSNPSQLQSPCKTTPLSIDRKKTTATRIGVDREKHLFAVFPTEIRAYTHSASLPRNEEELLFYILLLLIGPPCDAVVPAMIVGQDQLRQNASLLCICIASWSG